MRIDGSGTLRAGCVLCPNPGPMTLEGTNTWILREPGARGVVVVDPGPHDERHLERVARTVQEQGAQVQMTLLTHRHFDHTEGSRYFAELTGAPVHAVDPGMRLGGSGLEDGQGTPTTRSASYWSRTARSSPATRSWVTGPA